MADLRRGDVVDRRYELRRAIAQGGAATVFEAVHRITTGRVAIKLLRPRHARSAEVRQRLLREARALTMARHPGVVAALDAGLLSDDEPFLVMELLEGRPLSGLLVARGQLGVTDAVRLGAQLCQAVAAAHRRGVVHRDLKPHNLFVAIDEAGRERLKLFDFGIAAFRGEAVAPQDPKLTEQGNVIGTPEYMAPEQLLAQAELDPRSDIYGIGVTLYELLAGAVPFEGTYGRVLLQATTQPVPPLRSRNERVPEPVASVVERALAREPSDRFAAADELGQALLAAAGVEAGATTLLGVRPEPPPVPERVTIPTAPQQTPRTTTAPADGAPSQRRRHRRAPYITPVSIATARGTTLYGRSEDVSEGGLLVMTAQRCEEGERVEVRFALPDTGRFVEIAAVARWARTGRGLAAIGFEFVALSEEERSAIAAYVARHDERHRRR